MERKRDDLKFGRTPGRRTSRSMGMLLTLLWALPLMAQMEPCGFYERDQVPGYGPQDLWFSMQDWQQNGTLPDFADFNNDGVVNTLDFVQQANCVGDLSRGLIGKYYGFNDGSDGQSITFPDFSAIPGNPNPVVIKPAKQFDVFDGFDGFLNSEMRLQFGSTYEGYLWIPEFRNYTFTITGRRGMRVFIDGNQILSFDTSPANDETTMVLGRGLHPIRIEYYTNTAAGRISLSWESNAIPGGNVTIAPDYLYHASEIVPENTETDVEIHFDPPSGSRTAVANPDFKAFALGPDSDLTLHMDGEEQILKDGLLEQPLDLEPGLNSFNFTVADDNGRSRDVVYHIYYDGGELDRDGLAATFYGREWHDWPIPELENLRPFDRATAESTQLQHLPDTDVTWIAPAYLSDGTVAELVGAIRVDNPGSYNFFIQGSGALYINGEQVAGIRRDNVDQFNSEGEVELEAGFHHYRIEAANPYSGPQLQVYWSFEGGADVLIPNSQFRTGPIYFRNIPQLSGQGTQGRISEGLIAEYLFEAGATFQDTSGNGLHLWPDPRAIQRPQGGITYQSPGALSGGQAGILFAGQIHRSNEFSLEIDFRMEEPIDDFQSKELISLTNPRYGYFADLYIVNNDLRFDVYDNDGQVNRVTAENVIVTDQRIHVVATFSAVINRQRLIVDGVTVGNDTTNFQINQWENILQLNVGQPYRRIRNRDLDENQMIGTIFVAAAYETALNSTNALVNSIKNNTLNPTPGPLPLPPQVTYPVAGTTSDELDEAFHILNRLSFGPSPESVNDVLNMGVDNWITQQLNPDSIDDSAVEAYLASGIFDPIHNYVDLQGETIYRMVASNRQLSEVMAQFWENHFNTQITKVESLGEEILENGRFRTHSLGQFRDLLESSARHYPMTVYLDNDSNVVGAPNENYAREIMELHTQGVNNGYTQQDIEEASRCFTGWSVRDGKFFFNPGLHDYGEKNLLGITVPAGGGVVDGLMVIQRLVESQETADFITWKLCQVFIDDDPPADVLAAASATFFATSGDITQTLQTIFSHPRFRTDLSYRNNKIKSPLEFLTSILRMTESHPVITSRSYLTNMGMTLYDFAEPTGFAEEGVNWLDTNSLLERWNLIDDLTSNRGHGMTVSVNIQNFINKYGLTGYVDILDFFENLTTHGIEPAGVRPVTEAWLTDGNPGGFVLTDDVMNNQVRQTLSLYLRLSEVNKQ